MPIYLVRWPDLSASLVRARDEDHLIDTLDLRGQGRDQLRLCLRSLYQRLRSLIPSRRAARALTCFTVQRAAAEALGVTL